MSPKPLSPNDQALLDTLRDCPSMTVGNLVESLGVTATAVRQRLTRMMAAGLIQRTNVPKGRGRPSHLYVLTEAGKKSAGNNLNDLCIALWQEISTLPDPVIKQKVIGGAIERLTNKYRNQITSDADGQSVEDRMRSITDLFAERQIPVTFENKNGLPVIKVSGCPYPDLAEGGREICEMEKQLLSNVVGTSVGLSSCQQDGDHCCSFQANDLAENTNRAAS